MRSYQSYVATQSRRNPCLLSLCQFLADVGPDQNCCRIESLEVYRDAGAPIRRTVDVNHLPSVLLQDEPAPSVSANADMLLGRILIVQDVTRSVIEVLGSSLDIDPLFFASHVYAPWQEIATQTPDLAILPSRARPQKFMTISYHRTAVWHKVPALQRQRLLWRANVDRKVALLPPIRDLHVILAQHVCSVLKTESPRKGKGWLGLVLVDPPVSNTYFSVGDHLHDRIAIEVPSQPFLGGFEDFLDPPSIFDDSPRHRVSTSRRGLFEDLMYYWDRESPDCFNLHDPSLLSLAYYPLRIVAAEWANYVSVMHYSIREYEYSIDEPPALFPKPDKLYSDLCGLQSWRRRSLQSQSKIDQVKRFIISHEPRDKVHIERCRSLLDDYEHIAANIDAYGRRLENTVPVVTSLVQIADSRRSYAESSNVRRLTYLAQVFVPLTFTSGLFSMKVDMTPGSQQFWVYLVIALPVTLLVFLVARPPLREICWLFGRIRALKGPEVAV